MPQFSSYPVVTTVADADKFMISQDATGSEKLLSFSDLRDAVAAAAPTNVFLASQYTPVTFTDNGGGNTVDSVFQGSIRGTLTIPANTLVLGSVIRIRLAGKISTSANGRVYNLVPYLQGQAAAGSFYSTIASTITNQVIIMDTIITVTGIGAGGSFSVQGSTQIGNTLYPQVMTTSPALDTTASALIAVYSYWGAGGNANDTVTFTNSLVELF